MLSRRWVCLGALTALGGCGFQPVYMPTASGKAGPAKRELQSVFVGIIPDRPGQILRQALQDGLSVRDAAQAVAVATSRPRRDVYARALKIGKDE